jgi:short-subunit dehydrogenase
MTSRVWLIGASDGIGAALARRLAKDGHVIALSARNAERMMALSSDLAGAGHLVVPLDVRDPPAVNAAWDFITERWAASGGVDVLIYNAGAYEPMGAKAFNLDTVEKIMEVNITGAFRALACVLPGFVARRSGHIVLVGSIAGYRGLPNAMGYGASKAAINHLAVNLKLDLAGTGVKVQRVCPGFVKTRLTDKNDFPMPFLMSAEAAADCIAGGMKKNRFEINFPWQMAVIFKLLNLLPDRLYFALMRHLR